MNKLMKTVVASALGLSLIVSVVGVSLAADPAPTAIPKITQGQRGPMNGRGIGMGAGPGYQGNSGRVGDLLGITAEEIHAERAAGKSLAQIAQDKGIDEATLVATILDARKAALDARVAAGTLTQEQADAAYAQMQTRVKESVNRTAVGSNPSGTPLGLGWGRASRGASAQQGLGMGQGDPNRFGGQFNR